MIGASKFELGRIEVSPAARICLTFEVAFDLRQIEGLLEEQSRDMMAVRSGSELAGFLARHQAGDWGNVSAAVRIGNEVDLESGGKVFSDYELRSGGQLRIITYIEQNRTMVKCLEDYKL